MENREEYKAGTVGEGWGVIPSSSRCEAILNAALLELMRAKPEDRSIWARRYAVTITELEKVIAYFSYWVVQEDETASDGNSNE